MEFINALEERELMLSKSKAEYWKKAGSAYLEDEGLDNKWCNFVDELANDSFIRGALLDETLQVISMIKSGISCDIIAKTIEVIPSGQTILDDYLPAFIHPEIISEIQSCINEKSK